MIFITLLRRYADNLPLLLRRHAAATLAPIFHHYNAADVDDCHTIPPRRRCACAATGTQCTHYQVTAIMSRLLRHITTRASLVTQRHKKLRRFRQLPPHGTTRYHAICFAFLYTSCCHALRHMPLRHLIISRRRRHILRVTLIEDFRIDYFAFNVTTPSQFSTDITIDYYLRFSRFIRCCRHAATNTASLRSEPPPTYASTYILMSAPHNTSTPRRHIGLFVRLPRYIMRLLRLFVYVVIHYAIR